MFEITEHSEHDKINVTIRLNEDFMDRVVEEIRDSEGGCYIYDAEEGIVKFSVTHNSVGQKKFYEELKGLREGDSHPKVSDPAYFNFLVNNLQRMGDGVEHKMPTP